MSRSLWETWVQIILWHTHTYSETFRKQWLFQARSNAVGERMLAHCLARRSQWLCGRLLVHVLVVPVTGWFVCFFLWNAEHVLLVVCSEWESVWERLWLTCYWATLQLVRRAPVLLVTGNQVFIFLMFVFFLSLSLCAMVSCTNSLVMLFNNSPTSLFVVVVFSHTTKFLVLYCIDIFLS